MFPVGLRVGEIIERALSIAERVKSIGERVKNIAAHVPNIGARVQNWATIIRDSGSRISTIGVYFVPVEACGS